MDVAEEQAVSDGQPEAAGVDVELDPTEDADATSSSSTTRAIFLSDDFQQHATQPSIRRRAGWRRSIHR